MAGVTKLIRRVGLVAAAALVVAGVGGVAAARAQQAQPAPGRVRSCARPAGLLTPDDREAIGRMVMTRVKERVGLSDQQAEEIRTTLNALRDGARADLQTMCEARQDLRRLLEDQNSDPAALKAAADRVNAPQGKLLDRRLDAYLSLRSKLNADQWAKWVEFRREMGQRWRGRSGGFGL